MNIFLNYTLCLNNYVFFQIIRLNIDVHTLTKYQCFLGIYKMNVKKDKTFPFS